jgi:hypothetical protein
VGLATKWIAMLFKTNKNKNKNKNSQNKRKQAA